MSTGSSVASVKQALKAALDARPALADVTVNYDAAPAGEECVFFGNASTTDERIPVMKAGVAKVDERYLLEVNIQVLARDGQGQEAADLRAVAILGELQQILAETPQLTPEVFTVQMDSWEHFVGVLGGGGQSVGSRFEVKIRVHARLYP